MWREEALFRALQAVAAELMADIARACDARYAELITQPGGEALAAFDTQVRPAGCAWGAWALNGLPKSGSVSRRILQLWPSLWPVGSLLLSPVGSLAAL